MTYEQWEADVPDQIRSDTLWRMKSYRLALFLADLAWTYATKLLKDLRTRRIADQLFRAASNISSNLAEGYSRASGKDRARFYEYALGSIREARDWYYKGRRILGVDVQQHRMTITAELARLVVTMVSRERRSNRIIGANG